MIETTRTPVFSRYEVLEKIGSGGMGTVYKARDRHLVRWVALKVLPHGMQDDPEALERFKREARALARLKHPRVAAVYDAHVEGGFPHLVMEYVEGDDLYRHSKWLAFMERRLLIAKELLNPEDSVLIVTIDEKEYLRRGLLLEQIFKGARIQMVSVGINPAAVARNGSFDDLVILAPGQETAALERRPASAFGRMGPVLEDAGMESVTWIAPEVRHRGAHMEVVSASVGIDHAAFAWFPRDRVHCEVPPGEILLDRCRQARHEEGEEDRELLPLGVGVGQDL